MSQFSTLMSQHPGEAEQKKVTKYRVDRRRQTFRKTGRLWLLLILVAAFAAAFVYRHEVQAGVVGLTTKSASPPYVQAEQGLEAIEATYK